VFTAAFHSLTLKQIDEGVINASRKHLRTVCGDSLDNLRGKNYEVSDNFCGYWHSLFDLNLEEISSLVAIAIVVVIVYGFVTSSKGNRSLLFLSKRIQAYSVTEKKINQVFILSKFYFGHFLHKRKRYNLLNAKVDPFVFNIIRFSHFLIFTSQIVIDDCTKVMREFVRENKTFDFVINDLTDIVIQSDEQDGKS